MKKKVKAHVDKIISSIKKTDLYKRNTFEDKIENSQGASKALYLNEEKVNYGYLNKLRVYGEKRWDCLISREDLLDSMQFYKQEQEFEIMAEISFIVNGNKYYRTVNIISEEEIHCGEILAIMYYQDDLGEKMEIVENNCSPLVIIIFVFFTLIALTLLIIILSQLA